MALRGITAYEAQAIRNAAQMIAAESYKRSDDPAYNVDVARADLEILKYLLKLAGAGRIMLNDRENSGPTRPRKAEKSGLANWPSEIGLADSEVAQQIDLANGRVPTACSS